MIQNKLQSINENLSSFFKDLKFEEGTHTYTYKNKKRKSVSKLIDSFVEKIDWDEKAELVAIKKGVSKQDVLNDWEQKKNESIIKGHSIHEYAETFQDKKHYLEQQKIIDKFLSELPNHIHVVSKEQRMVHKELFYCGTADLILYDSLKDSLIIADYKTNKDLFKNFKGKRLKEPFFFLEDCPYNKYQIQLILYQLMIEQVHEVSERWIIHITDTEYIKLQSSDFKSILLNWLWKQSEAIYIG